MKRIVLVLLILLGLNIKVEASDYEVYYSEYSSFSEYSEEKIDSSELMDVEEERRYRFYKEKTEGEYIKYELGENKYPYVDYTNYIVTEFSEWQETEPSHDEYRTIETKSLYKVKKLKPIQTLMFAEFSFGRDKIKLEEIEIYVKGEKIQYSSICGDCYEDDRYNQNAFIMIDFNEPYYLEDINIKIISSEQDYINDFTVYAVEPGEIKQPRNIYASYNYQNSKKDSISISIEDFTIVNPKYEEEIIYDTLPDISNLDYLEPSYIYRYQDKYYYFYNVDKEYVDGYHVDYSGYIKDETDYRDFYRYRTREKIVVHNKMYITRYDHKVEDFIDSTVDYRLETNVNYLENGVYTVRYITDFQTITKEVTVDIEDNDLRKELEDINRKYNELMDNYNLSQKQLEKLNNNINIKNQEISRLKDIKILNEQQLSSDTIKYEQLLNDYNLLKDEYKNTKVEDNSNYITSLKEQNEKCSDDLNSMKLRNDDNEKKLKLSNQANDYLEQSLLNIKQEAIDIDKTSIIPFVLVGLIILLLVVIFVKKMSSKN